MIHSFFEKQCQHTLYWKDTLLKCIQNRSSKKKNKQKNFNGLNNFKTYIKNVKFLVNASVQGLA